MVLELSTPRKRTNYYYIQVTEARKPISLAFFKANIVQVYPMKNQDGYVLILKICDHEYNKRWLIDIQEFVLESLVQQNRAWFKNELSAEKINEMFKRPLNDNELIVYYSNARPPASHIPNFQEWQNTHKYSMPIPIKCKIVCEGLYIYAKQFTLRWTLSNIDEYVEDTDLEMDSEQRMEIEEYWRIKCDEQNKSLEEKIGQLRGYQEKMWRELREIQESVSLKEWNLKIDQMKNILSFSNSI